ncbi:MAG: helix-turn-helix transcriptional regulator [Nitrospirota bacterium]
MRKQNGIPRLVRELRNRLGLSQEKFAARLGVTSPTINRWENARAKPSPLAVARIREIAVGLGQDGARLLERYFPEET